MRLRPSGGHPASAISAKTLPAHPVLFFPVGAYLIIYRAIRPTVEVVAVTQGARDIPSFLQRRLAH
jgi:antitoxin ParD1/3/4/toxin ParE1/3/4